jgi:hypothetical protein
MELFFDTEEYKVVELNLCLFAAAPDGATHAQLGTDEQDNKIATTWQAGLDDNLIVRKVIEERMKMLRLGSSLLNLTVICAGSIGDYPRFM